MNFIIQKLKSKHTSLKKYTNWTKLIHFSLVLREREEKKPKYFAPQIGQQKIYSGVSRAPSESSPPPITLPETETAYPMMKQATTISLKKLLPNWRYVIFFVKSWQCSFKFLHFNGFLKFSHYCIGTIFLVKSLQCSAVLDYAT